MAATNSIEIDGIERKLGLIPPAPEALKRRAKMKSFADALGERGLTILAKDTWKDVRHKAFTDAKFVLDQHNSSGCVGYSEAAAEMKIRALRGMPFERLSGSFTYAFINGGQDGGAMILDALESAEKNGHALESEFNYPKLFKNQIPAGVRETALKRRSIIALPVNTIEEVSTALQLGFIVQAGVQVDGNFNSFNSAGVSNARGQYANHSIHLCGMLNIGGEWVYEMPNTWGLWGPFRNGTCYLRAKGVVISGDAWVHMDAHRQDVPVPA